MARAKKPTITQADIAKRGQELQADLDAAWPEPRLSRADKRALMAAVLYQPRQAAFNSKTAIQAALLIADDILAANETFRRPLDPAPEPVPLA